MTGYPYRRAAQLLPEPLSATQRIRVRLARVRLDEAEEVDLVRSSPETVAVSFERMRGSLADVMRLIEELHPEAREE